MDRKDRKGCQGPRENQTFLGRGSLSPEAVCPELAKGVADIGDFSGAYAPMGYAFEKSMRMAFWGVNDRKLARKVYYAVMDKYPQLEEEFTTGGIKVMAYASIPPYQLLVAKKKVATVDDVRGLTIKASGDLAKLATALGGEGVVISMGETYTALQKTTIDGAFAPYETLKTFRFAEVVDYIVELNIAAAPAGHWGFSMKSWNKLPKDIQMVFLKNMEWFGEKVEELMFAGEEKGIALAKQHNANFVKLSSSDLEKVYKAADSTMLKKMGQLDAKGMPGTAVYKDMRALIKHYGH